MIPLRILICGRDSLALQPMAQRLSDEGVKVQTTTNIMDCFYWSRLDLLLIDLDRLPTNLRGLLPAVRRQFPSLRVIGIATQLNTDFNFVADSLELDYCLFKLPRPEDLIACFPCVAANYLFDAEPA